VIEIKELVCDISNIASFNKRYNYPKIVYIDLLFATIPKEIEITGIADCSLYHQINDKKRSKVEYLTPRLIFEAPAGFAADNFILVYALRKDAVILSNDRFAEYEFALKEWLKEHRIRFMIIKNQLILQKPLGILFKETQMIENNVDIQEIITLFFIY